VAASVGTPALAVAGTALRASLGVLAFVALVALPGVAGGSLPHPAPTTKSPARAIPGTGCPALVPRPQPARSDPPAPTAGPDDVTKGSAGTSGMGGPPGAATSQVSVTIVVPPVAVALLAASGTPVAVETNNSQPPDCGDLFFVTSTRGGQLRPGSLSQENRVLQLETAADGTWQSGWNPLG
jgi:hypothetical protein